jgi:hypothetical protein
MSTHTHISETNIHTLGTISTIQTTPPQYDLWGAHLPEVPEGYTLSIGAENFKEVLRRYGGPTALQDWEVTHVCIGHAFF